MGMGCPCDERGLGQETMPPPGIMPPPPPPPPAPPLYNPEPGVLPVTAQERIRSLCQRMPDLCVRLCSKYPLANAFLRSGCATPAQLAGLRGLGQDDAAAAESELAALETELAVTPQEAPGYYGQASDIASGAVAWLGANPMLAIGAAVGVYLLLASGRKR